MYLFLHGLSNHKLYIVLFGHVIWNVIVNKPCVDRASTQLAVAWNGNFLVGETMVTPTPFNYFS